MFFRNDLVGEELKDLFFAKKENKIIKCLQNKTDTGGMDDKYNDAFRLENGELLDPVGLSIRLNLQKVFDYIIENDKEGFKYWADLFIPESMKSNNDYYYKKIVEQQFYSDYTPTSLIHKCKELNFTDEQYEKLVSDKLIGENYKEVMQRNKFNFR